VYGWDFGRWLPIKVGRLIEVRLYFDFLALLLTRCVTAPVSVSRKFNRTFAVKIHAKISFLPLLVIFKNKG